MEWLIIGGLIGLGLLLAVVGVAFYWIGRLLGWILTPVAIVGVGAVRAGNKVATAIKATNSPEALAQLTLDAEDWAKTKKEEAKDYWKRFHAARKNRNTEVEEPTVIVNDDENFG
jgi:phosphate/sulfate permease